VVTDTLGFQSFTARPEFAHVSFEECRLEDLNNLQQEGSQAGQHSDELSHETASLQTTSEVLPAADGQGQSSSPEDPLQAESSTPPGAAPPVEPSEAAAETQPDANNDLSMGVMWLS
jgi:hypothetical protein